MRKGRNAVLRTKPKLRKTESLFENWDAAAPPQKDRNSKTGTGSRRRPIQKKRDQEAPLHERTHGFVDTSKSLQVEAIVKVTRGDSAEAVPKSGSCVNDFRRTF